jgi:hypothetical protein
MMTDERCLGAGSSDRRQGPTPRWTRTIRAAWIDAFVMHMRKPLATAIRRVRWRGMRSARASTRRGGHGPTPTCTTFLDRLRTLPASRIWGLLPRQIPSFAPAPRSAATPRAAKIAAAMECTSFIGILVASLSPTNTTGTSANRMPSVVPTTTNNGLP